MNHPVQTRNIGAWKDADKLHVRTWAPFAGEVFLVKGENRFSFTEQTHGYWEWTGEPFDGGYKIGIGAAVFPDPASTSQPEGVHGDSYVADVSELAWDDHTWKNPSLQDYIIYELHIGTFTPEGTFDAAVEKLDHLLNLGVTAVEIMPVASFPGDRNWGYDGVALFAVQQSYGGAQGLARFVDACHNKGLAVVLDVVYNHVGPEGNYLPRFGPYFTKKYQTPWGDALNFDDEWSFGVRHLFIENALMWLRDFHVDALRLDAVHAIKDSGAKHFLRELREQVDRLVKLTGKKYHLIAECDLNDSRYIDPVSRNGLGMDAQWCDEFHHALRVSAGNERTGYYADFNGVVHLAKSYTSAYVYDGQYSEHRKRRYGMPADNNGEQFVVFTQNHDQVGNRMMGERLSTLVSANMQKVLAGAVMMSPFVPLLFMGEEWREPHPFLYFVSHGDAALAGAVKKGRRDEFKAFHEHGEAPDPNLPDTFLQSKLQWDIIHSGEHADMLEYYRKLIALRKKLPALATGNRRNIIALADESRKLVELERWNEGGRVYAVLNFSDAPAQLTLPVSKHSWRKLFASCETAPESSEGLAAASVIVAQPESFTLFTSEHV
jgi:maltooligosyltrehalose trehalohydrolase